ncbi:MAG: hypothetical protein HZB92_06320 [Euryarchaeota archaeon]|nr:hypothetical protein [Euryarchaeota archaeon]
MGALKYVLYILSFLFWPLGIIIGIVFMISNEPEKKQVGKMCIILAILSVVLYVVCYFFIFAAIFGGMMGI